ncbi:TPA: hypothetical protein ACQZHX_002802, partial [Enterobacter sichuanensis]
LQSSNEHKVNGMSTRAVCSPSPQPSPSRERGLSVQALFYGDPSAHGERGKKHRTKFTILSRFLSKNEWLLAIHFNSFIKIPPPEILPS